VETPRASWHQTTACELPSLARSWIHDGPSWIPATEPCHIWAHISSTRSIKEATPSSIEQAASLHRACTASKTLHPKTCQHEREKEKSCRPNANHHWWILSSTRCIDRGHAIPPVGVICAICAGLTLAEQLVAARLSLAHIPIEAARAVAAQLLLSQLASGRGWRCQRARWGV